ncbi:MAG: hydrogenase expression/formation protein HypE [Bacteroidales bacterium]|nr:hydrogenase expression/formation protein HypE [Bacteroidales bacterium]
MSQKEEKILLAHGSGGLMMQNLLGSLMFKEFGNEYLDQQTDSATLPVPQGEIAFTTDSFVIDPIFFPGGNIGKLAVCGTVNDLAVSGAIPLYLSVSLIIEEGLPMADLETIVKSLSAEAKKAGVKVVTGDTKVVNRGKCDKIFINTAGVGQFRTDGRRAEGYNSIKAGDCILVTGTIGDHGMAILNARESFHFKSPLLSDCACLNGMVQQLLDEGLQLRFMRDPTRGGVAAVLNELVSKVPFGIEIEESALPLNASVKAMAELLGFDPLSVANEGKLIIVASEEDAPKVLSSLKNHEFGKDASIIGRIVETHPGKVAMTTLTGGKRLIDVPAGELLPRIC